MFKSNSIVEQYLKNIGVESINDLGQLFDQFFGGQQLKKNSIDLGYGITFKFIELDNLPNKQEFGHLYKDGVKISNSVYRLDNNKFKEDCLYIQLMKYEQIKPQQKPKQLYDIYRYDKRVIVNTNGVEIFSNKENHLDYLFLRGGNILESQKSFYNLLTGELIISRVNESINGKNNIIIKYDPYSFDKPKVEKEKGIYILDKITCQLTKIDDI